MRININNPVFKFSIFCNLKDQRSTYIALNNQFVNPSRDSSPFPPPVNGCVVLVYPPVCGTLLLYMEGAPTEFSRHHEPVERPSKIDEYVARIQGGETLESFGDIPDSWKTEILTRMHGTEESGPALSEGERKEKIAALQAELLATMDTPVLSPEELTERKKLHGWTASYELARIAREHGVDLSQLSREEYVDFAIQNALVIDDSQLRVAPWQRTATSVQEIVEENRRRKALITEASEKSFAQFTFLMRQKAATNDRAIAENIRVRQGTKDSDSWLYFAIGNGATAGQEETYKSYVSVKDLNTLTPERFTQLLAALRDAGYVGDVKIFQDLSEQGVRLNDQVVMHGASEADAKLALQVAERFFGDDLDQKSFGKDEVVDGKNKSYSQLLADKIAREITY